MLVGDACFRELCVQILSVRRVPSTSLVRLGQLCFPGHVVVCPAAPLRPGVGVQSLLSQVHGATFVLLCTLVFVTRANVFACPQLVKNCPSTQLRTHEVRDLSRSLVWSGLSVTEFFRWPIHHWCNKSCISIAGSVSHRVSCGVHSERILDNVQRHTAITFRHLAASRTRFKPAA